ncbi:MAG: ECF transporter S component [Lachnospiraceae bacterium]|nr:ECF transporter S component [Lachnospiraceae bacterium]
MNGKSRTQVQIRKLTLAAVFMALTIILSTFSIPVPGGHLYFCDAAICTGAILLGDPIYAFIMGGFGSFLGDVFFNPPSMYVSLVTHGLQAAVIALCASKLLKKGELQEKHPAFARVFAQTIGLLLGAVIMVVGYTLGRAYVYSTPEYAIIKLPFEIIQALFGVVVALILCAPATGLVHAYRRYAGSE